MVCYLENYSGSADGGSAFFRNVENTSTCHTVQKLQNRISIGGVKLTGEIEVPVETPVAVLLTNLTWTGLGLNTSLCAEERVLIFLFSLLFRASLS